MRHQFNNHKKQLFAKCLTLGIAICSIILLSSPVWAQDGNAGIAEATNKVKSYFDTGCDLMYAIGAVVGIIGAVKVFNKWNAGEPDTNKVAAAWFGSCIFLVVVATVLKSFFGI
jgi:di/tricarboxylate transporter